MKELPEYLNFNLMRFAYDIKSEERKKNKATIRYPKSMTLKGVDFDLSAMIVHLGSSVSCRLRDLEMAEIELI